MESGQSGKNGLSVPVPAEWVKWRGHEPVKDPTTGARNAWAPRCPINTAIPRTAQVRLT